MNSPQERGISQEQHIGRKDDLLSPVAIATGTAGILEIYFKDIIDDLQPARYFLERHTIGFLNRAERGFGRQVGQIAKRRNVSMEDMNVMFDLTYGNHKHDPDDHESFAFSAVVFSIMPEVAEFRYLPTGFSRRGTLAPPFTIAEFLERVQEMRREVAEILIGQTTPRVIPFFHHPLLRTTLFFEVARQLPDMYKEHPTLVMDKTRQTFEALLGDIVVDFDTPPTQEIGIKRD